MEEFLNKDDKINNLVNSSLDWDITKTEKITKIDNYYTLSNNENNTLTFSWKTDFIWSIKLKNWWPLYFEIFSYSWTSIDLTSNFSTWILYDSIIKNFTWYLNSWYDRAELSFKNLWWFSSFVFKSSLNSIWTWVNDTFKVIKNIWWMKIEKTIIEK
jgi:hypothetical protein